MAKGKIDMIELTPKQDGFCLSYIETGNASEAYRLNYDAGKMSDTSINRAAKELLDNPKIAPRLARLKQAHSERHNITVNGITDMYQAVIIDSTANKQYGPTVSAITGLAKLHGLFTEKIEVLDTTPVVNIILNNK